MKNVLFFSWYCLIAVASIGGATLSWGDWKTVISVGFGGVASSYFLTAYVREIENVPLAPIFLSAKHGSDTRPLVFVLALFCLAALCTRVFYLMHP